MSNQEFQEYNQSLMHIWECKCEDVNCQFSNCNRLKQILHHTGTCTIRTKRNCPTCHRLMKICFYHVKDCYNDDCTVPLCSKIKQVIMDMQVRERIEKAKLRRRNLVKISRRLPDHLIKRRPPG